VELRATRDLPSDGLAIAAEQQAHADAVAEVTWSDGAHRQARLHVHLARTGRWVDRSIGFQPSDADAERGRTIGFAVASMIPEAPGAAEAEPPVAPWPPSPPAPPAPPAPPPPPAPSGAPAPVVPAPPPEASAPSAPLTPAQAGTPSAPDRVAAVPPTETPVETEHRWERFTLDVAGIGAVGQGGDVDGVGAEAAVHWFPLRLLAFRLGAGARAGSVQAAQSTTLTLLGTAGVALHVLRATRAHRLGVWVRADYVLERQSLTYFSANGPALVGFDRLMSGIDALVGVDWMFAPDVGLVAGVGGEDVFSPTYIENRGATVGTLPALRGVAEVGFRIRF
jgi:hypothetical protein